MTGQSVNLFISYSHRDEELRQQLDKHLAALKRQKVIETWHDRKIEAGMEWAKQIDDQLNKADIILLLISPDFICSNYCFEIEMQQAIKQHESGQAIVMPIILEPCDWTWLPFSKYQAFPKNAKAITTWTNVNEAFLDVIQGIRTVAERFFEQRQQQLKEKEAAQYRYLQKVEEILSFEGEISIPGQDTLDELREELRLTPEEAIELQNRAFEPYRRYQENLQKYEKTFLKIIQQEYPLSEKSQKALLLRQRDLGIKPEDAEQREKEILAQQAQAQTQKDWQNTEKLDQQHSTATLLKPVNNSQPYLEVENKDVVTIQDQKSTALIIESKPTIQSPITDTKPHTIDPIFIEHCQQQLARYIGPMASFILETTLSEYPQITRQKLVELLSTEIPNSQHAQQFQEHLRKQL